MLRTLPRELFAGNPQQVRKPPVLRTILRKKSVKVIAIAQVQFLAEKQILQQR
jgi:hypothetical protein